tara:strand:- start:10357 stop:10944 length:588 start_codon:yes stop_codon:yes gene_type:complete
MSKSGDWYLRTNPNDDVNDDYEDDGYDDYVDTLRREAEQYIMGSFDVHAYQAQLTVSGKLEDLSHVAFGNIAFHKAIWYASTEILPSLEIQVVIDGKNKCFVTTGSSGYVEFGMKPPVGMTLPIRCWIHTHPFGSAYFSGVDIKTVSTWKSLMECAYVIGGDGHYGYWEQETPNQLEILRNYQVERIQTWGSEEE